MVYANIESLQSLEQDSEIICYELSNFNKSSPFEVFPFSSHDGVVLSGVSYIPLAASIEGLEITSAGQLPSPTLSVSDATTEDSQIITGLIDYYGDGLVGSTIAIKQILRKHLDDGIAPNPAKVKPVQKFQLSQVKELVPGIGVSWELTTPLELLEVQLPTQICLTRCTAIYRDMIQCPFADVSREYDIQGQPVPFGSPQAGCGKTISDCKLRFGSNVALPMMAYPALTRF